MKDFELMIKDNFDTFLILAIIIFLIKEGVEDIETILALVCLLLT